jgi:aspartate racemase
MRMKNANGRVLGVIGGMGPLATQLFYKMVIENTDASCDQDHIDMIILSHASMPDRTLAIEEERTDELVEKLSADARFLEESGATCIAVPCNTTHVILPKLQEKVGIPIIDMIE